MTLLSGLARVRKKIVDFNRDVGGGGGVFIPAWSGATIRSRNLGFFGQCRKLLPVCTVDENSTIGALLGLSAPF